MKDFIRLRKTPPKQRYTYKIKDERGRVICEVCPGEKGVTQIDIKNAHSVDDHEVYENLRQFRPHFPDWLQKSIDDWSEREREKFVRDFGREPENEELPRYEHLLSLDALMENDECNDSCNIIAEEILRQQMPESEEIEHLRELVKTFPPYWQEIYRLVLIAGMTAADVAKMRGVTEWAIHKIVRKIKKRIAEDENLKKIFHGGTVS